MADVLMFLAFLALTFVVGIRLGFRLARADLNITARLARFRRDVDVCDEAAMGECR